MTSKEAAKLWGCSVRTVQKYCRTGIIPDAVKKRQWTIPDDQQQPPATRTILVKVLAYIKNCNEKTDYKFRHPFSEDAFMKYCRYLQEYGFISELVYDDSQKADFAKVSVSNIGEDLISKEKASFLGNKKLSFKMTVKSDSIAPEVSIESK